MKIKTLILAVILMSGYLLAKETLKAENKKIDIVGEAFNTDNKPVVAVSYGVANNSNYKLRDDTGYIKPEMVMKLSEQVRPPLPGPLEPVNEVRGIKFLINTCLKINMVFQFVNFRSPLWLITMMVRRN